MYDRAVDSMTTSPNLRYVSSLHVSEFRFLNPCFLPHGRTVQDSAKADRLQTSREKFKWEKLSHIIAMV